VDSCHYRLNLLESGGHVVAGDDVYGGTHRLFRQVYEQCDFSFGFVDTIDHGAIDAALTGNVRNGPPTASGAATLPSWFNRPAILTREFIRVMENLRLKGRT
jgi:hypothetical protein